MKILVDNNIVDVTTIAAMTDIKLDYDYEFSTEIVNHSFVFSFDIIFIGKQSITISKLIILTTKEINKLNRNIRFIEDFHGVNRSEKHENHMTLDEFNEKLDSEEFDDNIGSVNKKLDVIKLLFDLKNNEIKSTQCPQYVNFNKLRFGILKMWNDNKIDLPTFNLEDY